ncbi:MAG: pyruvate dehydrogenase (acetyl-transferring) E1 component subunit alpha [Thermaerobacterales bacterium]
MPECDLKNFEIVTLLKPDGTPKLSEDLPDLSDKRLLSMYRWMVMMRQFDARAVALHRQGRMGTFPPLSGQEAAQVGSAFALKKTDWLFPSYREHAATAVHGMPLHLILLYWMGREEGAGAPEDVCIFTPSVPIATQIPHAVGAAWAAKLRGDSNVAIVYFGDGATSEGDFHEGANFAGVFNAPCVMFCQNNHYAISIPVARQTASRTIAQKAVAYGIRGVRVDGNDILAVYQVTREAVERARAGEGPTLIEAVTYRYGPHTTVDDPRRYRDDLELQEWKEQRDPITRFRNFLTQRGLLTDELEEQIEQESRETVAAAVAAAEQFPAADPGQMFDFVLAEPSPDLAEQKKAFLDEGGH